MTYRIHTNQHVGVSDGFWTFYYPDEVEAAPFFECIIPHNILKQFTSVSWQYHLHFIVSLLIRCRYRRCVAVFPSLYIAARHQYICKYCPVVTQESFTRETFVQASSHLQSSTTVPSRILEPSAGTVDVAFSNVDSKDMILQRLSGGEDIENKRTQTFENAELILKFSRVGHKKLTERRWRF